MKQKILKRCKKCHAILSIEEFHLDKGLPDGHRNICKTCAKERAKQCRVETLKKTSGLFDVLHSMKGRCYNPKHNSFARYGGRGITICAEWLENPACFYTWCLEHGYQPGLQIDRINNNLGYCPENCRFVSRAQNQHNTSRVPYCEQEVQIFRRAYKCGAITQKTLAEMYGVSQSAISRICSCETWKECCK